ncbi:plasmid recombination protein [Christensenellaceae bacterium OttesenSCG-928-L17]|nr:plasmid recombination protein [Christensenellaceae bacterium OttesenSCG-928-L17]
MAEKSHFTVVRNAAYTASSIGVRERHNERKNESYYNADIVPERANFNVHFWQNFLPDGQPETYEQTFNRLLEEKVIVKRGLKADAKVFDELVFDVNTAYFEENGGYDFAKKFYEAAYRLAVEEVGGEEYILSAVMHADEKNTALSQQLGRDVYHYHLHVVYVPVVEKQVLWSKRCKDPALVGTVKEVIPQISHSKKWPRFKDGKGHWINSYSLLQDRFHDGMRAAGFDGFTRGERGSTAEHLEVLDYKIQQDTLRLGELDAQAEKKKAEVDFLVEATKVRSGISASQDEIDKMARPGKSGYNKIVANADWETVSTMAKRCLLLDAKVKDVQSQVKTLQRERDSWKTNYNNLWDEVKDYIRAIRSIPNKLRTFISEQKMEKTQAREETK